ncbi:MAG TPA: hypothetical protein PKD53_17040 [Chloroflexaceae bacterium]|nr:hypothetical protein [Chloroflexaceae bacterium]
MYLQARVFIKTALGLLLASVLLGALLLANQGLRLHSGLGALLPVYYHLLMFGWATQLICGVALWLFPPLAPERPRGDERLGWFAYGALNGGLALRAVAEPLQALQPSPWSAWGLAAAALLQVLAVWAIVFALWPRVKGRPDPGRKGAP